MQHQNTWSFSLGHFHITLAFPMNEESPAPDWFLTLIHLIALVTIVSYALTTYVIIKAGSAGGTRVNRCFLIVVVTV